MVSTNVYLVLAFARIPPASIRPARTQSARGPPASIRRACLPCSGNSVCPLFRSRLPTRSPASVCMPRPPSRPSPRAYLPASGPCDPRVSARPTRLHPRRTNRLSENRVRSSAMGSRRSTRRQSACGLAISCKRGKGACTRPCAEGWARTCRNGSQTKKGGVLWRTPRLLLPSRAA